MIATQITDGEAVSIVGHIYTLFCRVFGPSNINVTSYQWIKNDHPIEDQSGPTLVFSPLALCDAGLYRCKTVVNSRVQTSEEFTIRFNNNLTLSGWLDCDATTIQSNFYII